MKNKNIICIIFLFYLIFQVSMSEDVIKMGIYDNSPKEFIDKEGTPSGFFIDITNEAAKRNNLKIQYIFGTWEENLTKLEKGELDAILDVSYTQERSEKFILNNIYVIESWIQVFAKKETKIESLKDLSNKKIAVPLKSVQESYLKNELSREYRMNYTIVSVEGYLQMIDAVNKGEADCLLASRFFAFSKDRPHSIVAKTVTIRPKGVFYAFRKDFDKEIITKIDKALFSMKSDPNSVYYKSFDKWLTHNNKIPLWIAGDLALLVLFCVLIIFMFVKKNKNLNKENLANVTAIIENTSDGIWAVNKNYKVIYTNHVFRLNVKQSFNVEIKKGDNILDVFQIKKAKEWKAVYDRGFNNEKFSFEEKIDTVRGIRYLRININPIISEDKVIGVSVFASDITKEKKVLDAILEEKNRFFKIFEASPVGLILMNKDAVITHANEDMISKVLRNPAEVIGKRAGGALGCLNSMEDPRGCGFGKGCVNCMLRRSITKVISEHIGINNIEIPLELLVNGEVKRRWLRLDAEPVELDDGSKIIVSINDITEQKNIEEKLIEAKETADKANIAKSEFLSNMSHEIRTPMNGIIGFIEILLNAEKEPEKKEYLEMINFSADHLMNIINDILSISKIEAGEYQIKEKNTNIFFILNTMAEAYTKQAEAKGVKFIFEYNERVKKPIYIDQQAIIQILNNLLNNSLKFTEKGYIRVFVDLEINDESGYLELEIEDTGIGINKAKQERLYEPFVQGEHYLTKKYGGTGLGLSIVKKLTDILNGEINVETSEGKGTKFLMKFPVKAATIDISLLETEEKIVMGENKSIRIISAEDIEINQILLENICNNLGWDFKKVYNGRELLEELETGEYDLILMDIQMPEMNGLDAAKSIRRSNKKYKNIPIIGISAFAMEEDIRKAKECGINEYLSKPIKKSNLIDVINMMIE